MDPNANLAEQEQIILAHADRNFFTSASQERLMDLRQALYDWIRDGGFEPDWTQAPNARQYFGR